MIDDDTPGLHRETQVCFFFNAQRHQVLHGVATAVELARKGGFRVYVVSPAQSHVDYARAMVDRLGGAPITFVHARSRLLARAMRRTGSVVPPKLLSLMVLARWLNTFDAICLPERTSMILKRMGVRRPRFIHLDHGAGDRAAGFDTRIRHFDFVLMAGTKHLERLTAERLVTPGRHAVVGYPKFDAADAMRDPGWYPFTTRRPVVLYNPHFSALGSWESCAERVLEAFAAQHRYNLVLAPHVRLLDSRQAGARWSDLLDRYDRLPHIHVDRGSDRAIDMTYTSMADIYVGDVSSQVYEFLRTPRPCLFLNARDVAWRHDENYAHWHYGEVVSGTDDVIAAVDRAFARHPEFAGVQAQGMARTFAPGGGAAVAGQAIAAYLAAPAALPARRAPRRDARVRAVPRRRIMAKAGRAAALVSLLACGWLLGEAVRPATSMATEPFLDRAVASHRTTILRGDMRSQPEIRAYDAREIGAATGIALPDLPKDWKVDDAQIYPSTYGPLVQIYLTTPLGETVSLVAMRIETDAERKPLLEDRTSERVAYWEDGDTAFALVSHLPSARLLALAAEISRG